jgi:hypothetical protein
MNQLNLLKKQEQESKMREIKPDTRDFEFASNAEYNEFCELLEKRGYDPLEPVFVPTPSDIDLSNQYIIKRPTHNPGLFEDDEGLLTYSPKEKSKLTVNVGGYLEELALKFMSLCNSREDKMKREAEEAKAAETQEAETE